MTHSNKTAEVLGWTESKIKDHSALLSNTVAGGIFPCQSVKVSFKESGVSRRCRVEAGG
jgi:hypothetical protein